MPTSSNQFVTKQAFADLLQEKLGEKFPRAEIIFANYGERLSQQVSNALLHAADQDIGKIETILKKLEDYWERHLIYKHPEQRGTEYNPGVFLMFEELFSKTLGITPAQT